MAHTRPLHAHMIHSWDGATWEVFVAEPDEARWPHVPFPVGDGVPTISARTAALRALGYAPLTADTAWEWMETFFEGDPEGTVSLIASVKVAPVTAA
ncbi:DUF6303 family protein [Streptomyces sp. NPDC087422]|uniref:DUF6303 family protein n=1 Tax=Streptomyces sp. NPDC087422 TaxID=3365786 RepID=UPI003827D24B